MGLAPAPKFALVKMKIVASAKTTPSRGRAQRSKTWMKLWPKVAIATCATTMMKKVTAKGRSTFTRRNSACSANAPLTLLTMNQPMVPVKAFRPAGRMLPRNPNAPRLSTIMGTPNFGPHDESTQCVSDPRALPRTMARNVSAKLRPNTATPSTPPQTVANSRFGESQVQKRSNGFPWRSRSEMYSTPPGSTVATLSPYSPSRTGTCCSTSWTDCIGASPSEGPKPAGTPEVYGWISIPSNARFAPPRGAPAGRDRDPRNRHQGRSDSRARARGSADDGPRRSPRHARAGRAAYPPGCGADRGRAPAQPDRLPVRGHRDLGRARAEPDRRGREAARPHRPALAACQRRPVRALARRRLRPGSEGGARPGRAEAGDRGPDDAPARGLPAAGDLLVRRRAGPDAQGRRPGRRRRRRDPAFRAHSRVWRGLGEVRLRARVQQGAARRHPLRRDRRRPLEVRGDDGGGDDPPGHGRPCDGLAHDRHALLQQRLRVPADQQPQAGEHAHGHQPSRQRDAAGAVRQLSHPARTHEG